MHKDIQQMIKEALVVIQQPAKPTDIAAYIAKKTRKKQSNVLKNVRRALKNDMRDDDILECNGFFYILETTERCLQIIIKEELSDDYSDSEKQHMKKKATRKDENNVKNETNLTGSDTDTEMKYCSCDTSNTSQTPKSILKKSTNWSRKPKKLGFRRGRFNAKNKKKIAKPNTKKKTKTVTFSKPYNLRQRPNKKLPVTFDYSESEVPRKEIKNKNRNKNRYEYCTSDEESDQNSKLHTKRQRTIFQGKNHKSPETNDSSDDTSNNMNKMEFALGTMSLSDNSSISLSNVVVSKNFEMPSLQALEHHYSESFSSTTVSESEYCYCDNFNIQSMKNLILNSNQNENPSTINECIKEETEKPYSALKTNEVALNINSKSVPFKQDDKVVLNSNLTLTRETQNIARISRLQMSIFSSFFKKDLNLNTKTKENISEINNISKEDNYCDEDDIPSTSRAAREKRLKNLKFSEPNSNDGSSNKH